jgi:hypothetical protein
MRQKIKSVFDVIAEEKEFEKFRRAAKNFDVVEKFGEIFPDIISIAKPVKVEKNILYLHVDNSVWRSELNLRQKLIAERVNAFFKEDIIKSVKFI